MLVKNKKLTKEKEEEDKDLSDIFENILSFENEIKNINTKKIAQYRDYLKSIKDRCYKLLINKKYEIAINDLNNEIEKNNDIYVKNELLRIMDDLKYEYYSDNKLSNEIKSELSYPVYYDPDFSQKIYKKAEFYQNKLEKVLPEDVEKIVNDRKSGIISLAQHQRFLKNFMSRNTPYNGLLIFHGLGVGKTCASIAIAETLRPMVLENNQKIIIISKSHFDRGEIFNIDRLKNKQNQCAGDTFETELKNPELIEKCQEGHIESCKVVKYKIDKMIKGSYEFYGFIEWAKFVLRDLQKVLRGVPAEKREEIEIARIKKLYSNTLMIIDEVHNIKDVSENKSKVVPPVLMKVLLHAQNLRLVLLSGTPMFNEPADLVSLLNYLLINDKRPILKESEIFKKDGSMTSTGQEILKKYSTGYVSFLRSENPINYPIRFSSSINGDNDIIKPSNYPKKNIYGDVIQDTIKHLEIIECPMSKEQEKVYESYLNKRMSDEDEKTSAAFSSELQILNFIYQDLNQTDNLPETYGEKGLNSIMNKEHGKNQYSFNDPEHALELKGDKLKKYSSKIHKIMKNIEKCDGLVFIYTEYEMSGILPLAFALELEGYKKYKSSDYPVLLSDHKDKKYKGDYLIISGNVGLSKYYESYLEKKHNMIHEPVKVILATRAASEGINLFGVREIHVLNPWHNLNRLSQAIGRGLRSWSHIELPLEERNITVYLYAATVKSNNKETIDLKIYREAESKAINIGIAEDILRRNAIDCPLNKNGNMYTDENWGEKILMKTSRGEKKKVSVSDKPYSHICHYLKNCEYECFNPPKKYELNDKDLDYSTYNLGTLKYEVNEMKNIVSNIFSNDVILTLKQILKKLPSKYSKDEKIIYQTLQDMIDSKYEVKDKYDRMGYIIYRGNYYIFQPLQINNEGTLLYQRGIPPPIRPNKIDITEYVNKMEDHKKNLVKKNIYQSFEAMEYILEQIENIKERNNSAFFVSNIELSEKEIQQIVVDRLIIPYKKALIERLLMKEIKETDELNEFEKSLIDCLKHNIIRKGYIEHSRDKSIFGYRLIENDKQVFYKYNLKKENFDIDESIKSQILDLQKVNYINDSSKNLEKNNFSGYLKFEKINKPPVFKLRNVVKGDKKSIKGISCLYKSRREIYNNLKTFDNKVKSIGNKKIMCDNIEIYMRRNDIMKKDNKRWFFNVEESAELESINFLA